MFRAIFAVPLAIGTAAAVGVSYHYDLASLVFGPGAVLPEPSKHASPASPKAAGALEQARRESPTFDIVRIEPNGVSVFAGRAMPNSTVTLFSNDRPVATTRANPDGEWSLVTEHPFAPGENRLALSARAGEAGAAVAGQTTSITVPARTRVAAAQGHSSAGLASAANGATAELERQVAAARSGNIVQPSALPVPITFLYNEANFTPDGQRAALLLAEYLKLTRLGSVTLTGHADERGSDAYNMELSRQRLHAVARFLKAGGYTGKLVMIPKGRSEPYSGVNRNLLPLEQAFQLDRRVELRLAQ